MVKKLALQMFECVVEMHMIGYLHRDIKPHNFRVKNDKVYLIDFGTIRRYLDEQKNHI